MLYPVDIIHAQIRNGVIFFFRFHSHQKVNERTYLFEHVSVFIVAKMFLFTRNFLLVFFPLVSIFVFPYRAIYVALYVLPDMNLW